MVRSEPPEAFVYGHNYVRISEVSGRDFGREKNALPNSWERVSDNVLRAVRSAMSMKHALKSTPVRSGSMPAWYCLVPRPMTGAGYPFCPIHDA